MLKRQQKALFYAAAGGLMRINGIRYRLMGAPSDGMIKVHLGPGQERYLPGWINADANIFSGKADLWIDLNNPLPFRPDSVDAFYSHHVVEHLKDLRGHFQDAFRCLKKGGIYRVGGPNGDMAIKKFVENDMEWFSNWPDERRSIGGRFENFIFCRQEHLTILTRSFLEELMGDAGFTNINVRLPERETGSPDLFADCLKKEHESNFDYPKTLILEAEK